MSGKCINRVDKQVMDEAWRPSRTCLILVVVCIAANSFASGQTEKSGVRVPTFEVVSVKPSNPRAQFARLRFTADGYIAENASLLMLIRTAYGYSIARRDSLDEGIAGVPNWVKTQNFDIAAKVGDADLSDFKKLTDIQRNQMLQGILADRFKLSVHQEIKQVPQFALVVGKNGPKVAASKFGDPDAGKVHWSKNGLIEVKAISMSSFDQILSQIVGRTVQDKTGLTGLYDLTVHWTPDPVMPQSPSQAEMTPTNIISGPSVFTALQEQLGLKLESTRGPEETLVIDHVERPLPN